MQGYLETHDNNMQNTLLCMLLVTFMLKSGPLFSQMSISYFQGHGITLIWGGGGEYLCIHVFHEFLFRGGG